jgi:hypothetical protein
MRPRAAILVSTLGLTVLATGCGSGTDATPQPAKAPASATTSPEPGTASKSPVKTANVCKDAKNDGTTNDLTSVVLKRAGDSLYVTWTMVKRETAEGSAGFYLSLASEDGKAAGQLGVQYSDGQQVAYFTFRGVTNKEISGTAKVTGTSVTGSFPMSELAAFGPNFEWQAVTTLDDEDTDYCPGSDYDTALRFDG